MPLSAAVAPMRTFVSDVATFQSFTSSSFKTTPTTTNCAENIRIYAEERRMIPIVHSEDQADALDGDVVVDVEEFGSVGNAADTSGGDMM